MVKKQKTILTCDPSLTAFGWAVMTPDGECVAMGCVKTEPAKSKKANKTQDKCRRISEINSVLLQVIQDYNVFFITSEQPTGSQSATAAIMIGVVLGLLQTISDTLCVPIHWVYQGKVKKTLLGKDSAEKKEMVYAILKLYPDIEFTGTIYKDEAIADAIAVFHTSRKECPWRSLEA